MEILKNNIERLCSFYVSDWHLVTMLLPYINKQIKTSSSPGSDSNSSPKIHNTFPYYRNTVRDMPWLGPKIV